ncbi:MAG: hypothetical protein M3256_02930 [Actinomycetota bacterium]|nr:hypothetical protein [Actinomycetota bacterium]
MTVGCVIGVAVVSACGTKTSSFGSASVAEGCRVGSEITAQGSTKSYIVRLDIGPVETMYTQAEADSNHPSQGEVTLRGQMSALPGNGGNATASGHHLDAHICSKAGGAVIQDADPTITLRDDATGASQDVQIAVMQGVGADVGDLHYGNNVTLIPGASYRVTVSLNGETAILHIQMRSDAGTGTIASQVTDMRGMP